MQIFHADEFSLDLPPGHRFPISKYRRLRVALIDQGDPRLRFHTAPSVARAVLAEVHASAYVERVFNGSLSAAEIRQLGFPWSPALVERSQRSVGATIAALRAALEEGVAVSLAGGTHHATFDRGAGFCVFNDVAAGAKTVLSERPGARVLVVDCDVHQGDGTARMLADYAHAYTFSIHSARNYPHQKSVSDLDIGLPDGTGDAAYLEQLSRGLEHAFRQARPDVVFAIAGADVYAGDRLGRLALTKAGVAQRDELVFSKATRHAAALVVVMGGGYAADISDIVDIHCRSVLLALASWQERQSVRVSKTEPRSI